MIQQPFDFMVPKTGWKLPDLNALPDDWNAFSRIAIDTETNDEHLSELGCGARRGAYIAGVSLSFDSRSKFYLPIRHGNGTNLDAQNVVGYLREKAQRYTKTIVGANLGYDIDMLASERLGAIEFPKVHRFRDVLVADPLLNELENSYSLESVAQRRIGSGKNQEALMLALRTFAPKGTAPTKLKKYIHLLPPECVGPYGEDDAAVPLAVLAAQERMLEDEGLWDVWELESRLLPALIRMRRRGVLIDQDKLAKIEKWSVAEERKVWEEIHRLSGVRLNVGQSMEGRAVALVLDAVGVRYGMKGKNRNQPSIDKELLEEMDHPVGALIRRARKMGQLRTTFVASIVSHMTHGRIHGTLNQGRRQKDENGGTGGDEEMAGAAYGRLSGANPNMQQQPARDEEIGPMWRSIYLPEPGKIWATNDYSQQEPKWLIHASCIMPVGHPKARGGKLGLSPETHEAAMTAAARYRENPNLDCYDDFTRSIPFGIDYSDKKEFKKARSKTKEIYLGRCYGMGDPKMARKMGLPTVIGENWRGEAVEMAGEEAKKLIDAFDAGVPYAREMAQALQFLAEQRGYIRTSSGRKCRFPEVDGRFDWCHKSLNRLIQGSSGDETKTAVVQLDEAGYYIQLQVHDEIDGSYDNVEQAEEAAHIMRNAIPKVLPMKVDVETGRSWGEAK
ncbi:MAG: hypothetical protein JWN75_1225 [Candidatus Saccharibacteria bacterium]|nr:hypothetical protein [Candidatus Saccharibacteria bacterium]MDB5716422.1 hypothetical protein [Sphingomonadales bacterium]